jgi:hypothetical protein
MNLNIYTPAAAPGEAARLELSVFTGCVLTRDQEEVEQLTIS